MPNPAVGSIGASIGGSILSSRAKKRAGDSASQAQLAAAELQVKENRRQFNKVRKLLEPFVDAGRSTLAGQLDLIGVNGGDAQAAAIEQIENSPQFASLIEQGEDAILANAAATGGLRGGDTQGALAKFRPQILSSLIDQQYQRLGGITAAGQNAAAGVGSAAMSTGAANSQAFGQMGAARAGAALASGQAVSDAISGITGAIGFGAGQIEMPEGATLFSQWGF